MKIGIDFGNSYTYVFLDWYDDAGKYQKGISFLRIPQVEQNQDIFEPDPDRRILGVPSCIAYNIGEGRFYIGERAQKETNKSVNMKAQARTPADANEDGDEQTPLDQGSCVMKQNGKKFTYAELIENFFVTLFDLIFSNHGSQTYNTNEDKISIVMGRPAIPGTNYTLAMKMLFENSIFAKKNLTKWGFNAKVKVEMYTRQEPVLAAISICKHTGQNEIQDDESILVIDCGGGTTDFAYLGHDEEEGVVAYEDDFDQLSIEFGGNSLDEDINNIIKNSGLSIQSLDKRELYTCKKECFSGVTAASTVRYPYIIHNAAPDYTSNSNAVSIDQPIDALLREIKDILKDMFETIRTNNPDSLNKYRVAFIGASMNMSYLRNEVKKVINGICTTKRIKSPCGYIGDEEASADLRSYAVARGAYDCYIGESLTLIAEQRHSLYFEFQHFAGTKRGMVPATDYHTGKRIGQKMLWDGKTGKAQEVYVQPDFFLSTRGNRNKENLYVALYEKQGNTPVMIRRFHVPFPMDYDWFQTYADQEDSSQFMQWVVEDKTQDEDHIFLQLRFSWVCHIPEFARSKNGQVFGIEDEGRIAKRNDQNPLRIWKALVTP